MRHIFFSDSPSSDLEVAILIKTAAFNGDLLEQYYAGPLNKLGVPKENIVAYSIAYDENNKAPAALIKATLSNILKACDSQGITTLLVADGAYFKTLTKEKKADPHYGYIKQCKIAGYEHMSVALSINHQALFYKPEQIDKIELSLKAVAAHLNNTPLALGVNIIHKAKYPKNIEAIGIYLKRLHYFDKLTVDIEGYGLKLSECGIASIAFAWSKHEGIAFLVDPKIIHNTIYTQKDVATIKIMLAEFFETYKGTLIYHNATFDIKHIIFNLWMNRVYMDYIGAIEGIKIMYKNIHDTKIITYLATNNAQGNDLGLKENALEFAGNYAKDDIKDITKIPVDELLEYNLVDCLSTWHVYEKYAPKMAADNQVKIYKEIFLPSLAVITNMELSGMPLDQGNINLAVDTLHKKLGKDSKKLYKDPIIKQCEWNLQIKDFVKANRKLKQKVRPIREFKTSLNTNSPDQLKVLLYETLGLKVKDKTKTKEPATGVETIEKLGNILMSEFNITEEELK